MFLIAPYLLTTIGFLVARRLSENRNRPEGKPPPIG